VFGLCACCAVFERAAGLCALHVLLFERTAVRVVLYALLFDASLVSLLMMRAALINMLKDPAPEVRRLTVEAMALLYDY
jgi:hypothetical protein